MNNNYLLEIAGMATYKTTDLKQLEYNKKFFSKYIDIVKLQKAIISSQLYSQVIRDIEMRYNEEDDLKLFNLEGEVKELNKIITPNKTKIVDLYNMKIANSSKSRDIFLTNNINIDVNKKQNAFDDEIDERIRIEINRIAPDLKEIDEKQELIDEMNQKRITLSDLIESNISKLKESLIELEDQTIINDTNLDSLKEEYESGLKEIYPNDITRKVYVDYTFMMLKHELNMLNQILSTSRLFISQADKLDKYEVPEIALQNEQINTFNEIDEEVYQKLMFFINRTNKSKDDINKIEGEGFNNIYLLISGVYDYINKIPEYIEGKESDIKEYNVLVGYYEQAMNNFRNIGTGVIEGKSYEFAARVFNTFNVELNNIIRNKRKRELSQSMDISMQR